jgi:hypothetical protein
MPSCSKPSGILLGIGPREIPLHHVERFAFYSSSDDIGSSVASPNTLEIKELIGSANGNRNRLAPVRFSPVGSK